MQPGQRGIQEVYKALRKNPPQPTQDIEMEGPGESQNLSKEKQPAGDNPESGQIIFLMLLNLWKKLLKLMMRLISGINLAPVWESHRLSKKKYQAAQAEKNIDLATTFLKEGVPTHKLLVKQLNFKTVMKMMEGWNPVSLLNKQKMALGVAGPSNQKGKGKKKHRKGFSAMEQVMDMAGALMRAEKLQRSKTHKQ